MKRLPIDWDSQPLGTMSDTDLAARLGCGRTLVGIERKRRGIAPFVRERVERRCVLLPLRSDAYAGLVAAAAQFGVSPTRYARVAVELAVEPHVPVGQEPGADDFTETPLPGETVAL